MKLRNIGAAVGAGVILAATVPGLAQAADPPVYPPVIAPVTCSAKAVSGATKIKVNVNPNLPGNQFYYVRLQKRVSTGNFAQYQKLYKTQGKGETRTINVGKGTWRFKCYSTAFPIAAPEIDDISNAVKIRR